VSKDDPARSALLGPAYVIIKEVDPELAQFFAAFVSIRKPTLRKALIKLVAVMAETQDPKSGKPP
jgi:hypothetical protein